jgi:hypothetical protein
MSQEFRRRNAERALREQAGEAAEAAPDLENPRFSRGEEAGPQTPAKRHAGRFSEGQELEPPEAGGKEHVGRFDEGRNAAGELVDDLHVGRFGEGVAAPGRQPPDRPPA